MSSWIRAAGRLMRAEPLTTQYEWTDRHLSYDLWDSYYSNTIYERAADGGQREYINSDLGNASAADLAGLYNPIKAAVDLYLHVFQGAFGDEIKAETGNSALLPALNQIWQWSNLTIEKQPLCRLAATHGTVGLRIVARNDDDPKKRRVYIKPEHPKTIRDVELDDRGNVEAIQLEYDRRFGLAEDAQTVRIRETMTKEEFRIERVLNGSTAPFSLETRSADGRSRYPNELGVVPYVLLRHEHNGETWGRNAFYQARGPIDRLNALMSHIDVQIHKHVRAKWLVAAAGAAPTEFDFSDLTIVYVDTRNSGSGAPMAQPLIANLDLTGAIMQAKMQQEAIEDNLPELKATQGRFLAGQSGETIAELRKPAEEKLSLARGNYEDALARADQIAVSWGVLLDLWNVGTGQGTRDAADRAFNEGYEDHKFNKRPLLSDTTGTTAQSAPDVAQGRQDVNNNQAPNN